MASDCAWHLSDPQKMVSTSLQQKGLEESTAARRSITLMDTKETPQQLTDHQEKNARNITSIPLFGAVECINNKLPLDYLNNENVYVNCLLIKVTYCISGRVEKKITQDP